MLRFRRAYAALPPAASDATRQLDAAAFSRLHADVRRRRQVATATPRQPLFRHAALLDAAASDSVLILLRAPLPPMPPHAFRRIYASRHAYADFVCLRARRAALRAMMRYVTPRLFDAPPCTPGQRCRMRAPYAAAFPAALMRRAAPR